MSELISPHGGTLKQLYLDGEARQRMREQARSYVGWNLTARQLCDLELLLNGGFSPLEGFMGQADYAAVLAGMRLADGTLMPCAARSLSDASSIAYVAFSERAYDVAT